jgi:hydroxymethylpyrimidine pyrophosphatase-like HAD family hydrolase
VTKLVIKNGAVVSEQKPSIGRIVVYNHVDLGRVPAIIQAVMPDETVRLCVFGPAGVSIEYDRSQGDGPFQWNWPPRV